MPYLQYYGLGKFQTRSCKLLAFLLLVSLSNANAAYLPATGPKPLRFQTVLPPPFRPLPPLQVTSTPEIVRVADQASTLPLNYYNVPWGCEPEQPALVPAPSEPIAEPPNPSSKPKPPPATAPQAPPVFPQNLVPYFLPGNNTGTNEPVANLRVVEFNPPVLDVPRSSTATYKKE